MEPLFSKGKRERKGGGRRGDREKGEGGSRTDERRKIITIILKDYSKKKDPLYCKTTPRSIVRYAASGEVGAVGSASVS